MSASNWFGNLALAYKYTIVFLTLLFLVLIAGGIKLLWNRRQLKKHSEKAELEAGKKEDTVELNQREKDEGDLFGIRAIEAGFYAGVHQSRPTSRAASIIDHPNSSSSTLIGGPNSPLMKGQSATPSVYSLALSDAGTRRTSPPSMKLRPSDAELNGRRNHSAAVDMSLHVPPSPGIPRSQSSPSLPGSDSGDSDGSSSRRSMSPRSADFDPHYYSPTPAIPMPDALRVSYHSGNENTAHSQAASFNSSPAVSPTPPYPGNPPATKLPTLPASALRKGSRSPSPERGGPQSHAQSKIEYAPAPLASQEQVRNRDASHYRHESDASSVFSENRMSTYQMYQAFHRHTRQTSSRSSNDFAHDRAPSANDSIRSSDIFADISPSQRPRSLELNSNAQSNGQTANGDRQLGDRNPYYHSHRARPNQIIETWGTVGRQSTIVEVETPLASPVFPRPLGRAGTAL